MHFIKTFYKMQLFGVLAAVFAPTLFGHRPAADWLHRLFC